MNRVFDYNGTIVSPSKPVKQLKTIKKTFIVDSGDRDLVQYYTNGNIIVYLPRVYENVVSLRLCAGEFPPLFYNAGVGGAVQHPASRGNVLSSSGIWASDTPIPSDEPYYFLIDIEGLNKSDECSTGANRSGLPDGFFAKIPNLVTTVGFIEFNDKSGQDNIARFSPAIGKLDRLHIRTRLHTQQDGSFIYWTSDGLVAAGINSGAGYTNYSLTFEVEMLDNSFDEFSQFETHVSDRR
ncbi:MAG: hypothetical protein EB127_00305 [Alphaproteobacteria bacterium]|nr:hypothetical protein [Alphaproteobacteria bacterium]